ncbi:unnamed protein product [Prorocentrum cordatum]|uniref:Centrosomal protein of 162 kDa n=1 Tax=Prorocentrum cordatum TaxID=2364126 RepID=A0ABN9QVG8_9DINO|nr:unnamed protein product [Polarella glacialis]
MRAASIRTGEEDGAPPAADRAASEDRDRQLRELQLQLDLWRRLAEPATGSAVPEPGAGLGGGDPAGRPRSPPPGRRAPPRQEGPAASEGPRAAVISRAGGVVWGRAPSARGFGVEDREIQELQRSLEAARQEARAFDCPPAAELRPPAASPPGAAAEALPWSESLASAPAPRMLIAEKDGEIQELQRRLEAARRETRPPESVPALGPRPAAAPPAPSQPRWPESPVAVLADKDREIQELQRRLEVARQEASAVDRAPAPVQRFAAAPPSGGAAAAPRRPESPAAVPALSTSAADREQGIQELQRRLEVGRPEARAPGCAAAPDLRPAAAMPEPLQPCWPGSPAATSGPRPAAAPPASWQPRWLESPVAPAGPGHPLRAEGEGPWCRGGGAASCPASPAPYAASAGAEVARARAAARGAAAVAAAAGGRPPAMGGAVPRPPKVFWSMECGEAGSPHGPAASALLQEGARRERRLEAERREQALEIDRLRKLLEGEQARRLLELAAEEAKREDGEDDQLVQSLAAAARDASIQDAELHELAFCARTQATGSDAAARQLREARAEAESAAADAAETRARLRAEEGAAAERGALAERLRGEAAQARLEAERAAGDAAETRARLQGSEAALAEGSALAERLRGEAAQARAEAERASADAAEARARLKGSEAALAERDGLVDRLEGEVAQQRSELQGLRQSPPVPAGRRDSSGSSRAAGERHTRVRAAGAPAEAPRGGGRGGPARHARIRGAGAPEGPDRGRWRRSGARSAVRAASRAANANTGQTTSRRAATLWTRS